jgi:tryptophan 2,3-dioxygenase
MDSLLALQHPRTDAATEPSFIIMSQIKELLFKLLHTEFTTARDELAKDLLDEALWTLRRATRTQRFLQESWDVLGALTPVEFGEFRDVLGTASGFQSPSYRRLEFLLGNKNPKMLDGHRGRPTYDAVLAQLREPSLYDEVLAYLRRQGLDVPPEAVERDDPGAPYQSLDAVEGVWRTVYRDPAAHRGPYLLGEALMEVAALFARWRYTHLVTVQGLLGDKAGTGGTTGVAWLTEVSEHRFFPELWSVRSTL